MTKEFILSLAVLFLCGCNAAVQTPPVVDVAPSDLVSFEWWYTKATGTYCKAVNLQAFGPALNTGQPLDLTVFALETSAPYQRTGGTSLLGDRAVKVVATCFRLDNSRKVKEFNGVVPKDPQNLHPLTLLVTPIDFRLGLGTRTP